MITITSHLKSFNLTNKRVLLRADLNVPLDHKKIINDSRLHAILPTIDLIQKKGGKVILITHIDRPKGYAPNLSTALLIPWFTQKGYTVDFAHDLDTAQKESMNHFHHILILENLRFYPGEQNHDNTFASILAKCGDYYVNDAFGTLHRHDTSITLLPEHFPINRRTIGLLVERELMMLNKLLNKPRHPFTLIIGGSKTADKIPLLKNLISHVDIILLCPAIVFTFLKARNKKTGKSLVVHDAIKLCTNLLAQAAEKNVSIPFPCDYQVAHKTIEGPLSIVAADHIPPDSIGIAIGPETASQYAALIRNSKTIFFTGLMGFLTRKETLKSVHTLFDAMTQAHGFSIVAGGDSTAAAQMLGVAHKISYLSTGGGASLTYLSGNKLPGLAPFISHS